ncbi:helix-turn-helix domain-containing protein [Chryseobacterium rhizoplanae]|uniref:XRE family transcriptional regulator n=1 Tax=Chryseobacterium rhizoplanae TaxID=1609531 RepID=UPI001CE2B3F3|nr:helix-turn-helix domain-containing protein [Chryseobacterium rhizoplanae]UCA58500.1 helix-turn-helix domain-containing protein [Chryseobacterium rhizoplanae]
MSIFSDNIRFLRNKRNLSQQSFAESLGISRVRYSKYEDGRSEPPFEVLINISKFFNASIDLLLTVDVRKYSLEEMVKLPENRIVLPILVDEAGENKIEIVPHKASMGYLNGYSDPEYIGGLQYMSLPFLHNGKYRAFPAGGDSMPPYNDSTYFVGKYVESRNDLKKGKAYFFVTRDGFAYKRYADQNEYGTLVKSDNSFYHPYEIQWADVLEIWEYECSVNKDDLGILNPVPKEIQTMFLSLKNDIEIVKNSLTHK